MNKLLYFLGIILIIKFIFAVAKCIRKIISERPDRQDPLVDMKIQENFEDYKENLADIYKLEQFSNPKQIKENMINQAKNFQKTYKHCLNAEEKKFLKKYIKKLKK